MKQQRPVETVDEFKLRIGAIIRAKPEQIPAPTLFYGTQTAQRDGDDGGGLGTTVIATHTTLNAPLAFETFFTISPSEFYRYPRILSIDASTKSEHHVYQVLPRKDKRGGDLISDALRFGRVCTPVQAFG